VQPNTDSLFKRYGYKLSTNLAGAAFALVTEAVAPRGLGPKAYGDFNFLSSFFTQTVNFLDMGTSTAFYTKLSQRPAESSLVAFYLRFAVIVSAVVPLLVLITQFTGVHSVLWPGLDLPYVYLAVLWGILVWFVQVLNKMTDAYGLTVASETAKVMQRGLGVIVILSLFWLNRLTLTNFFYYQYFMLCVIGAAWLLILRRSAPSGVTFASLPRLDRTQAGRYAKEFYQYSHPLLVYALVGLGAGILDRWLLQYFAGSVQQGFFGLSYQIGAFCFLATSAMTPLLLREFSIAHGSMDIERMAVLFRRYIPALYSVVAYLSCFVAVQAEKVIYLFGGDRYKEALVAVSIMAFYPIHQTYGQLSGSVFYASGQTALYRNIGVTFMLLGLPLTYFLIAPHEGLGANLGATGLAIKSVALQFVAVNVQLYFNSRFLRLPFWHLFGHQLGCVACLILLSVLAMWVGDLVPAIQKNTVLSLLVSVTLYSLAVLLLVLKVPALFGLQGEEVKALLTYATRRNA
jgi:O-antigen/teichoic acid export membrane protein